MVWSFIVLLAAVFHIRKKSQDKLGRVCHDRPGSQIASNGEQHVVCDRPRVIVVPFPKAPSCVADDDDTLWWTETVGRIHEVDFSSEAPGSVPKRALDNLLSQLRAVAASVAACSDEERHEPVDDIWAARALIATDFDVPQAVKAASSYVERRKAFTGISVPSGSIIDRAITLVPFEDRFGRPVAIGRIRYVAPGNLEDMTNHYRSAFDGMVSHMLLARQERGGQVSRTNPLEQVVLCVDCDGMSWRNASMEYSLMFGRESGDRYLERIAVMYIMNPPAIWYWFFAMLDPILHPRTKRKIQLVKSADVRNLMRGLVGEHRADELLPPNFGGSAKFYPPPGEGRTLEEKVGALLAQTWVRLGAAESGGSWGSIEASGSMDNPGFQSTSAVGCMACFGSFARKREARNNNG